MPTRILVVEDDPDIAELIVRYLEKAEFVVDRVGNGRDALDAMAARPPDLVVLDLMLPQVAGLEVCRRLRSDPRTAAVPVIMLTARGDESDRIVGLELGADDYLPKPFNPRELLARLRAILRRQRGAEPGSLLRFGRIEIDRDARAVRIDGVDRPFTSHQFDLLLALAENPGRVMSRETLLDRLRGESIEAFDRSIDVHVSRIRALIEDDPRHPRRVITVRGAGYVFARSQDGPDEGEPRG